MVLLCEVQKVRDKWNNRNHFRVWFGEKAVNGIQLFSPTGNQLNAYKHDFPPQ